MAADRHLELCKLLADRESSFALVWNDSIMQTWYYTTVHLEALQASFLSETNVYLGILVIFGVHLGIGIEMTPPPQQTITET